MKFRSDSMYRNTKVVNSKYLDIMDPIIDNVATFPTRSLKITAKQDRRPDILAHELYGNAKLWWVFAEFNPDSLNDPIVDFTAGKTIIVPTRFS